MKMEDEIIRAIKRQSAMEINSRKSEEEIKIITNNITNAYFQHNYNFTNSKSILLKRNGKKRFVKRYLNEYSPENILCQSIKQIIDRVYKIEYPNRNKSIKLLFNTLCGIKDMSEFTIVKFDFKDYFNSVSSEYVFEKYIKDKLTDRAFLEIIKEFAKITKYAYAGLRTSNVISEIIAKDFDEVVKCELFSKGLIYYERYIDDTLLIFNENIDQDQIEKITNNALNIVFFDKNIKSSIECKTRFNRNKYKYISKRILSSTPVNFDYLGYEFIIKLLNNKCNILYGITKEKQDKNNSRIDKIIKYYTDINSPDYNNMELLRHRILAFSSRCVYRTKKYNSFLWKTKGLISNYSELRFLLGSNLIIPDTDYFLKNMINDGFARAGLSTPYFIKGTQGKAGYNLYNNMNVNKTLLLVEHIGYNKSSLKKICYNIGIKSDDIKGKKRGYGNLVRTYLIKVKVGY
jgi:hypothetical protein